MLGLLHSLLLLLLLFLLHFFGAETSLRHQIEQDGPASQRLFILKLLYPAFILKLSRGSQIIYKSVTLWTCKKISVLKSKFRFRISTLLAYLFIAPFSSSIRTVCVHVYEKYLLLPRWALQKTATEKLYIALGTESDPLFFCFF